MHGRFAQLVLGRCARLNAAIALGVALVPCLAARIHGPHARDVPCGPHAGCHLSTDHRPSAGSPAPAHRHLGPDGPCLSCQYLSAAKGMTWAPVLPMVGDRHRPHRVGMLVFARAGTPLAFQSRAPPLV